MGLAQKLNTRRAPTRRVFGAQARVETRCRTRARTKSDSDSNVFSVKAAPPSLGAVQARRASMSTGSCSESTASFLANLKATPSMKRGKDTAKTTKQCREEFSRSSAYIALVGCESRKTQEPVLSGLNRFNTNSRTGACAKSGTHKLERFVNTGPGLNAAHSSGDGSVSV